VNDSVKPYYGNTISNLWRSSIYTMFTWLDKPFGYYADQLNTKVRNRSLVRIDQFVFDSAVGELTLR